MLNRLKDPIQFAKENYLVFILGASILILLHGGVGYPFFSCLLGAFLCVFVFAMRDCKADYIIVELLLFYNLCSVLSSWRNNRDLVQSYAPMQLLLPVIYMILCGLPQKAKKYMQYFSCLVCGGYAVWGLARFLSQVDGAVLRLSLPQKSANLVGIIMVVAWFVLVSKEGSNLLSKLEPLILAALGATLSMSSFLSLGVGIIAYGLFIAKQAKSLKQGVQQSCLLVARAIIGIWFGLLFYVVLSRTRVYLLAWLGTALLVALCFYWNEYLSLIKEQAKLVYVLVCFCALAGSVALVLRPNALATFTERIEMIKSGLHYMKQHPIFGVGAYNWRQLNLAEDEKYFQVWTIHNAYIHVGTEFGILAMIALILLTVRIFMLVENPLLIGAFAAFVAHNMLDTAFLYIGVAVMLVFLLCGEEQSEKAAHPFEPAVRMRILKWFTLPCLLYFIFVFTHMPGRS